MVVQEFTVDLNKPLVFQNVPPTLLIRFMKEHRFKWADPGVSLSSAAALRASPYGVPGLRASGFWLVHTLEHEEFFEVIRLEGDLLCHDEVVLSRDVYLLQLRSGGNAAGACPQLVYAPIDGSFADDAPLLPSGFHVIPLDANTYPPSGTRTLDLASTLEVGSGGTTRASSDASSSCDKISADHCFPIDF